VVDQVGQQAVTLLRRQSVLLLHLCDAAAQANQFSPGLANGRVSLRIGKS
jgi:hypothetical protein